MLGQNYKNFRILFVDDASNYTTGQKKYIGKKLQGHIVRFNKERQHSLRNAYEMILTFAKNDDAVVLNLDADDWLIDKNVLTEIANTYNRTGCLLTYGECKIFENNELTNKPSRVLKEHTNIPYPERIIKTNSYRKYPFLPLHPRTWKVWLFKKIKKEDFLREDGSWIEFAEDQAIFYPMLEMSNGRFCVISIPLYVYSIETQHSDTKQNLIGLLRDELIIRRKKPYEPIS